MDKRPKFNLDRRRDRGSPKMLARTERVARGGPAWHGRSSTCRRGITSWYFLVPAGPVPCETAARLQERLPVDELRARARASTSGLHAPSTRAATTHRQLGHQLTLRPALLLPPASVGQAIIASSAISYTAADYTAADFAHEPHSAICDFVDNSRSRCMFGEQLVDHYIELLDVVVRSKGPPVF